MSVATVSSDPTDATVTVGTTPHHKKPGKEFFWQKDENGNIKDVPFKMTVQGSVGVKGSTNSKEFKKFKIMGQGAGNASIGKLKGKWICTLPRGGNCPMAWSVLAPTFAYGFK